MISVFGGVHLLAPGLHQADRIRAGPSAYLVDAFIVRMTIVPAVMSLLGRLFPRGGCPGGWPGYCLMWTLRGAKLTRMLQAEAQAQELVVEREPVSVGS